MDEKRLVDNCPSVQLNITIGEESGLINLSSVWESFNYVCSIETPKKEIIQLSCPHCNSMIKGKMDCEACYAPMLPLDLDLGGNICICSRIGCRNHFVKFVDLSSALNQLYIDAGHQGRPFVEDMSIPQDKPVQTEEEEMADLMRSGTFLWTYCPHCKNSLIHENSIKLKVDRKDKTGFLMLSPYLNVFTSRSTIRLPEDETIEDIKCIHCDHSLVHEERKCEECGCDTARVLVGATRRLVEFYICSRKGCTWHGVSREDLNAIRLKGSLEW